MDLSKTTWYVRLYLWCLQIIDKSRPGDEHGQPSTYYDDYRDSTNLCQFMRVILVWAPFVILLNFSSYIFSVGLLTYIPIVYFGFGSSWLTFLVVLVVAVAAVIGFISVIYKLDERNESRKSNLVEHKDPTFRSLLWGRIVDGKQKYLCPFINIR